eukprot:5768728-Prymnesium_polylepis.1
MVGCALALGDIIIAARTKKRQELAVRKIAFYWKLRVKIVRQRREAKALSRVRIEAAVMRYSVKSRDRKKRAATAAIFEFLQHTERMSHVTRVVRKYL